MSEYAAGPVRNLARAQDDDNPALRPRLLEEFIGQKEAVKNLSIFLTAARKRGDVLDHVLLYGPPGLGKTTIAQIISVEMGTNLKTVSGPALTRVGELAAILSSLEQGDVLFIDEIHRLPPAVEELLYSAMEDYAIDLVVGEGHQARSVRLGLSRFTLVGATTRAGALSKPFHDRFGIPLAMQYYSPEELTKIVTRASGLLGIPIELDGAVEIARRARGTPRIAGRLLRRVRDFADVDDASSITAGLADHGLRELNIDEHGLDALDRRYLSRIADFHNGGPVGVETLAAALGESRENLEDVVEPYLLQAGFLMRTSRGRMLPVPVSAPALSAAQAQASAINGELDLGEPSMR